VFVYEKPGRHFAENLSGAQLNRYLSWMRKMEVESKADDIDEMRPDHLPSVQRKGGDAVSKRVVTEMNRKLSINLERRRTWGLMYTGCSFLFSFTGDTALPSALPVT
jgi:hypothetical protein